MPRHRSNEFFGCRSYSQPITLRQGTLDYSNQPRNIVGDESQLFAVDVLDAKRTMHPVANPHYMRTPHPPKSAVSAPSWTRTRPVRDSISCPFELSGFRMSCTMTGLPCRFLQVTY